MALAEKWKGKEWYQIKIPDWLGDLVIGESPAMEAPSLKGRVVSISATDLTGDPSRYFLTLLFKIDNIDGSRALTKWTGHELTCDFVSRAVQVRTTRIDTNSTVKLKDANLQLKTFAITNRPVAKQLEVKIRAAILESLNTLGNLTVEQFVKDMVDGKLQFEIKSKLNKFYPIRLFEFRASKLL